MNRISFFIVIFSFSINCFAGPFGIEMGMTLEETQIATSGKIKYDKEDRYTIIPPKPHKSFETYLVRISAQYGVYLIKAIGADISTSRYGEAVVTEFSKIEESLKRAYGNFSKLDFLKSGSYWDEPEDFMMGLLRKERVLTSYWEASYDSNLPDNISDIILVAHALSADKGYINLEYYSNNYDKAISEKEGEEDSVF